MTVLVTVRGLPELRKRLEKLSERERLRASREVQAHAIEVRDAARSEAPRDEGDLQESIVAADTPEQILDKQPTLTPGKLEAAVGTELFYAPFVHFGLKTRGIRANPFLFRPFESKRHALLIRLDRAMKEEARAS